MFLLVADDFQPVLLTDYVELSKDIALSRRAENVCSFIEDEDVFGKGRKVVYRSFATLYFVFIIDDMESELGILDLIHALVETLDKRFENVCELDLVFNYPKVNRIVDEMVTGGQVLETNAIEVLKAVAEMERLEKKAEPSPTQIRSYRGPIR